MAHMMPAQTKDPKEYQQVQRRKENNIPRDLVGNAIWSADERQVEPGNIIWREDKSQKQVMAHIEYIKMEDTWFGLHYVKDIPYATIGSKIAKGKYGLKRKGGKTPNLYLWRNNPEPMLEEENVSEIPTILTAEPSPVPADVETITQGIAAIPTTNQPMDNKEPLQYFTPIVQTNPITQVNMATVGDGPDDDEEEEQVKTSKGGLNGMPLLSVTPIGSCSV